VKNKQEIFNFENKSLTIIFFISDFKKVIKKILSYNIG